MNSFEERLDRLETIAEKLRDGSVPIDTAASLFEEGITLAKELEKELSRLERRIEVLVNQPQNESETESPELELFDEGRTSPSE